MKSLRVICFALILCSLGCAVVDKSIDRRPQVIVDTDMAFDDWMALLLILESKAKILAVTVAGTGEAHCDAGVRNALALIRLAGRENEAIPVSCGDQQPMEGQNVFPNTWRLESDTMYGVTLSPSLSKPNTLPAVELLGEVLSRNEYHSITLIALGPLTNIAQAYRKNSSPWRNIKQIYIMGGAINLPGNIIIKGLTEHLNNHTAEWNFYIDPVAAKTVFESSLPITLVPLDLTNRLPITPAFVNDFRSKSRTSAARFIGEILERNAQYIQKGQYFFWDPVAAAIFLDESLCSKYAFMPLAIEVNYFEKDGNKILDPERSGYVTKSGGTLFKRVCEDIPYDRFVNMFTATINQE